MIDIFAIGLILGLLLDVVWWRIPYQKVEEGFEVLEHYHFAIIFGIVGVITLQPIFTGVMVALILGEWSQDHKFALGSGHFKNSAIIGVTLFTIYIILISISSNIN